MKKIAISLSKNNKKKLAKLASLDGLKNKSLSQKAIEIIIKNKDLIIEKKKKEHFLLYLNDEDYKKLKEIKNVSFILNHYLDNL